MFNPDGSFKDPSTWKDINLMDETTALKDFLAEIPANQKAGFAGQGWLDMPGLNEEFKQKRAIYAQRVLSQLSNYASMNNLSPSEFKELIADKPGLQQLINQYGTKDFMNLKAALDEEDAPWRTFVFGEDSKPGEFGKNIGRRIAQPFKTPMGTAITGAAAYGLYKAPKWAPTATEKVTKAPAKVIEKAKKFFTSDDAAKKTSKEVLDEAKEKVSKKTAKKTTEKGAKKVTKKATKIAAKKTAENKVKAESVNRMMSKIVDKFEKHGGAKIARYVTRKLGWKVASRTMAKILVGTVGGVATGGLATAAMAAWSAKDLYDVYNTIMEMDVQEQYDEGQKQMLEETIKASKFNQQ